MAFFRRMFGLEPSDNLRIIITRHGERSDFAIGKNWPELARRGHDPRIPHLTPRPNYNDWHYDPSLTTSGENQSASIGRKLLQMGYKIDYCYSSPAYRSVQTANKILEGQDRKKIPINIEPGLFECPAWYRGKPLKFIPAQYIAQDSKFNINASYKPIYNSVDPNEEERHYYKRSRALIRDIIAAHKYQGGTVLLSGHGGSIEAVTRGLRGFRKRHRRRPEHLIQEALRVDYCNFAILERDAHSQEWNVRLPHEQGNRHGGELSEYSIIPLYGVSTEHITQQTLPNVHRGRGAGRHHHDHHHHPPLPPQYRVNSYPHHYR